jgi:hypothetical protein
MLIQHIATKRTLPGAFNLFDRGVAAAAADVMGSAIFLSIPNMNRQQK